MNDDELDKFIEEDLKKDIDQSDSINEELVEQQLGEMGFLHERISNKLMKDHVCFGCKTNIDKEKDKKFFVTQVTNEQKGVVSFASVCEKCHNKLLKEQEKEGKQNGK